MLSGMSRPNVYAYVGGNPVMLVDPLGLWEVSVGGSALGHFGVAGLGAGAGFTFGSGGLCVYMSGTSTGGLGFYAGVGVEIGWSPGTGRSGRSSTEGVFGVGGAGISGGALGADISGGGSVGFGGKGYGAVAGGFARATGKSCWNPCK
jgi:hypothetical protein